MKIEQAVRDGLLVLRVCEARIDANNGGELKRTFVELAKDGQRRALLDLTLVQFIDSTGLGALVGSLKALGRDGELAVCGLNEVVSALFKLTRMERVFPAFPTQEAALTALAPSRADK
jgi:anti-sigma B factor antagonist